MRGSSSLGAMENGRHVGQPGAAAAATAGSSSSGRREDPVQIQPWSALPAATVATSRLSRVRRRSAFLMEARERLVASKDTSVVGEDEDSDSVLVVDLVAHLGLREVAVVQRVATVEDGSDVVGG